MSWSVCPSCELAFTNDRSFDAHRTGDWDARRCLTPEEMRANGWRWDRTRGWTDREPLKMAPAFQTTDPDAATASKISAVLGARVSPGANP